MAGKANFFSFQDAGESENDAFAFAGFVGQEETTEEALNIDMNFRVQNIPQTVELNKNTFQTTSYKQPPPGKETPKRFSNQPSPTISNNITNNNNNNVNVPSPSTKQNTSHCSPSSTLKTTNVNRSTVQMLKPITMKQDLTTLKPFKIQHKLNTSFQPIKIQRKIGSLTKQNNLQGLTPPVQIPVQNKNIPNIPPISFNKRIPFEDKP